MLPVQPASMAAPFFLAALTQLCQFKLLLSTKCKSYEVALPNYLSSKFLGLCKKENEVIWLVGGQEGVDLGRMLYSCVIFVLFPEAALTLLFCRPLNSW